MAVGARAGCRTNAKGESMRRGALLSAMLLPMLVLPTFAQDEGANIGQIYCFSAQPGVEAGLEDALKKHVDWHRKQKDTWTWNAWEVMTGPDTGRLCGGTFGHKWEDFDKPAVSEEADMADMQATFLPFVKDPEMFFVSYMPDVSRPAAEPAPMSSVIFFHTRFGMEDEFHYLVGEFHKAIEKTEMPWRYTWNALVSGGEGGSYALVLPLANFAAMNPSGKPFDEMLEEAYGEQAAKALLDRWNKVVEHTESQLTMGRPDLSYIPEP
jgi:hypothetical protein